MVSMTEGSMDIPVEVSDLTPEWMGAALGRPVERVEVLDAHSGTTGRVRLRLDGHGAPESVFVKLAPFDEQQRAFVRMTGMGGTEARFYAVAAEDTPVRTPRVFHADVAGDRYVMVLEDLIASGCRFPERAEADTEERAASTVVELARLHAAFWESPRFGGDLAWVPDHAGLAMFDDPADAARASGDYVRGAYEPFVDEMPEAFAEVGRLYADHTLAIFDLWNSGPRTLIHGDCHIGNLFVDGDRTGFYDWALLSRSPAVRDVAYTCCYSMEPGPRRQVERALLRLHVGHLQHEGIDLDEGAAWDQYRMFSVFAWVSATTTAAMGTKWQRPELSHDAMVRATAAVEDLDAIDLTRSFLRR